MADWPYSTSRWRRLRLQLLRAEPLCRSCRRAGKIVAATDVDHIQPVADGGMPWDCNNLQPLCHSCHSKKTNATDGGGWQRKHDRAVDPLTGWPLGKDHWWNCDGAGGEKSSGADDHGPVCPIAEES